MDPKTLLRKVGVEQPNEIGCQSVESKEAAAAVDENKQTTYGKLFQSALGTLEEYFSNSNLHGVRYFVEKKWHWVERFWWIVGFVTSICCCGALIHKIYMNWDQKSVIITIADEEMPVWDIPFPAVTICTSAKVDNSRYNTFHIYNFPFDWFFYPKYTQDEAEIDSAFSYLCDGFYNKLLNHDITSLTDLPIIQILRKAIPHINATIKNCLFDNEYSSCEFEEIITDHGVCYTFNMLNSKEIYYNDSIYTHLEHNKTSHWSLDYGYDLNSKNAPQTYPNRLFGSGADGQKLSLVLSGGKHWEYCFVPGLYIVLHTPGEIPQVSKYSFHLTPTSSTLITLKPNIIRTSEELKSYHPDRRNCYFNSERKLRFLRVYTQRNCELECLANVTLSLCGCVTFHLPRDADTPICGLAKRECYIWARDNLMNTQILNEYNTKEEKYLNLKHMLERCNCLPACNSITYDTEILSKESSDNEITIEPRALVFAPWMISKSSKYRFLERLVQYRYSRNINILNVNLNIFFKERKFITFTRSELYGTIDFIANCGGLLGFFIGASFLSVVELLYYFSLRLCCNQAKKKSKK